MSESEQDFTEQNVMNHEPIEGDDDPNDYHEDYDEDMNGASQSQFDDNLALNQASHNSSLQENGDSLRTKSIYLTSHDGVKFLTNYVIKKELVDTGVKNKRNTTLACRRQYLCMSCPYKEKSYSLFTSHLIGHRERKGVSKCRYCDFYEPSRTKLKMDLIKQV